MPILAQELLAEARDHEMPSFGICEIRHEEPVIAPRDVAADGAGGVAAKSVGNQPFALAQLRTRQLASINGDRRSAHVIHRSTLLRATRSRTRREHTSRHPFPDVRYRSRRTVRAHSTIRVTSSNLTTAQATARAQGRAADR